MGKSERFFQVESDQPVAQSFQKESGHMYAIAFDLNTQVLKNLYPTPSWENAYKDVAAILDSNGFTRQQGSVYFGDNAINAVSCVIAAQQLSKNLTWFKASVVDIRMLRIEEFNDLTPAL